MTTLDFNTISDDDFADAKTLPRKPAGRNSPPSVFAPMLRELMSNGRVKTTKKPYDSRKPSGGGASQVEQMERELRRAARQIGGKISIRKNSVDDNGGFTLSFSVKPEETKEEEENGTEGPTVIPAADAKAQPAVTTPAPNAKPRAKVGS